MPFYKRTALTKRCFNQRFNTGRPFRSTVNTVRARGFNAVKPSACWVWRPIKPNGASLQFLLNDKALLIVGVRHMTGKPVAIFRFQDLMEVMLLLDEEHWRQISMEKDASYFGDAAPRADADDGLQDENDATEKSHEDSSLKDNALLFNKTQVEDQEIELGNIPQSYAVPTTPHTRIHKDHPIEHVIGDVQSSVQTRRMTTSYSELGFLSAIYEGKTHQDLHTCLFACFLSQERNKKGFLKL
ncbi:hypothetical protein Tco_1476931 [Tanacetum coccineum]